MLIREMPQLVDPLEYLRRALGVGDPLRLLAGDEEYRGYALERLRARMTGKPWKPLATGEDEVASLLLALYAAARAGRLALARLVEEEAMDVARKASGDGAVDERLAREIASLIGFKPVEARLMVPWVEIRGRVEPRVFRYSVSVYDALRLAGDRLDLVHSMVKKGRIYTDASGLLELAVEAIKYRLLETGERLAEVEVEGLEELVEEARRLAEQAPAGPRGHARPVREAYPECVRRLIAKAESGRLTSREFYTLATFLAYTRDVETMARVLEALGVAGGVAGAVAEVILEEASLWKPYNCEALGRMGVCECRGDLISEYNMLIRRVQGGRRAGGRTRGGAGGRRGRRR